MSNIAVIDGDTIIYLATYNKNDEPKFWVDCFTYVDGYMRDILAKCNTNMYTGYLTDGSFRYKIATQKPYKGNRVDIPKPMYFNLVKAYLLDNYHFITVKDYEADDLCIMTHKTLKKLDYNPIIASPDKDLRQIAASFYDYKKQEFSEVTEAEAEKNLWRQVLTGDSGDNIQGLIGIGPVKADKILEGSTNYPKTVVETYMKTYGLIDGVKNFGETYRLIKLVDNMNGADFVPVIQTREFCTSEFEF